MIYDPARVASATRSLVVSLHQRPRPGWLRHIAVRRKFRHERLHVEDGCAVDGNQYA